MRQLLCTGLALALLGAGVPALADREAGDLRIENAWIRETPPGTPMGAGYLTIVNTGDRPDRLVAARSPVAGRTQLHRSVEVEGSTEMRHQEDGVALPAGETVRFEPGGLHVMFMGLKQRLEPDTRVRLTLEFERAGTVELEVPVRPLTGDPESD